MDVMQEVQQAVAKFDLLTHPFYQAWSAGQLTAEDLRAYAADYYHHVAAFPTYLSALHSRLPDGELRRAVLRNLCEEEIEGTPHSEMWLDFAEGMGNDREAVRKSEPGAAVAGLIEEFRSLMQSENAAAALGALYAYESQVPRIAREKASGLKRFYGADGKTCRYFQLHETADVEHSRVWGELMERAAAESPESGSAMAAAAGRAARALWNALDSMEARRTAAATV
jgi:pyrroloquinoline-quinone synthase